MNMQEALQPFRDAYATGSAIAIANFLSPVPPPEEPDRLYDFWRASTGDQVEDDIYYALKHGQAARFANNKESDAWRFVIVKYWYAVDKILKAKDAKDQGKLSERRLVDVFDAWKELTDGFRNRISNKELPNWTVLTLYYTASNLYKLALQADAALAKAKLVEKPAAVKAGLDDEIVPALKRNEKLEAAGRVFNTIFALCMSDRESDLVNTRKWGVYCIANLMFRTYFRLNNVGLSKSIVRSIEAQSDLPPFELYPASHRVAYKFYLGLIFFLQEDYTKAEAYLMEAWNMCLASAQKNKQMILTYLIPCRLITQHTVPTVQLLSEFPHLQHLFGDLVSSIKKGDLSGFDRALAEGEPEFVKRRVFLTLERSRDIALRNLLRKVFLAGGWEDLKEGQTEKDRIRKTRVPLANFAAALRMGTAGAGSGLVVEDDEVECLLANMIYKGLMKGYISREHGMVVLNKKGAFPGTGV